MFFPPLGFQSLQPADEPAPDPNPGPSPTPDPPSDVPEIAVREGLSVLYQDRLQTLSNSDSPNRAFNLRADYINQWADYANAAASKWGVSRSWLENNGYDSRCHIRDAVGGGKCIQWDMGYPYICATEGPSWMIEPERHPGFTKMYVDFDLLFTGFLKTMSGGRRMSGKFVPGIHCVDPTAWSPNNPVGPWYGKGSYYKEASTKQLTTKAGNFRIYQDNDTWANGYFDHPARKGGSWWNGDPYTSSKTGGSGSSENGTTRKLMDRWFRFGLFVKVDTNGLNGVVSTHWNGVQKHARTNYDWFGWVGNRSGLTRNVGGSFRCSDGLPVRNKNPEGGWRWVTWNFWPMNGGNTTSNELLPHRDCTFKMQIKNIRVWAPSNEI